MGQWPSSDWSSRIKPTILRPPGPSLVEGEETPGARARPAALLEGAAVGPFGPGRGEGLGGAGLDPGYLGHLVLLRSDRAVTQGDGLFHEGIYRDRPLAATPTPNILLFSG